MSNKPKKTTPQDKIIDSTTVISDQIDTKNEFPVTNSKALINKFKLTSNQVIALVVSLIAIGATLSVSFVVIPYITDQTDEAKAAKEKRENEAKAAKDKQEKQSKLASESTVLKIDQKSEFLLNMKIKIADTESKNIRIKMVKSWAPKTIENFVRLTYRGYYDNMLFHRLVEEDDFKVIQGGDPTGNGSGGETASGDPLVDELWAVKPVVSQNEETGTSTITNDPQFIEPSLYSNFDKVSGSVTYRKGLILMAKTQSPDSASSQFFITLDKTVLPADYTVFGVIEDASLSILDNISTEVDPQTNEENPNLTRPSKDVKIEKVEIL
jgi:cyclophilin family peptidyl-prolyl cis-trans isomerase